MLSCVVFINAQGTSSIETWRSQFNLLSVDNGLSNNTILCMAQDKYGFLWMGTEIGLNRYDSDEIKQFFHSPSDSSGLSNSKINTILSDSQGELWIGTAYGLNRYIFEENSFDEFLFDDDGDQLPGKYIRCLFQDTDNDMWVGILLNWKTRFLRTTTTVQK